MQINFMLLFKYLWMNVYKNTAIIYNIPFAWSLKALLNTYLFLLQNSVLSKYSKMLNTTNFIRRSSVNSWQDQFINHNTCWSLPQSQTNCTLCCSSYSRNFHQQRSHLRMIYASNCPIARYERNMIGMQNAIAIGANYNAPRSAIADYKSC